MKTKQIAGRLKKSLGRRGALKRHMPLAVMLIAVLAAVMANYAFSAETIYDRVSAGDYVDVGLDKSKGVSMNLVEKGLTHKVLEFEIASDISAQDIQLLIAENNFDAKEGSLSKLSIATREEPVYETSCTPYDLPEDPINHSVSTIQNCTTIQTGTNTIEYDEWLPVALTASEENGDKSLSTFNILSKGRYRYSFDTPIINTGSGWGNAGTVFLKQGDSLFADKQHSSWWDVSFHYRKPIQIDCTNEMCRKYYTLTVSGLDTTDTNNWNATNPNAWAVACNGAEVDKVIGNTTDLTSDGTTKYYPASTGWATANTTFMFRLPQNITGVNNTVCYAYYGYLLFNSTATNISNIALLYDDFNRANSTTVGNNWIEGSTQPNMAISSSQLRCDTSNSCTIGKTLDVGTLNDADETEIWTTEAVENNDDMFSIIFNNVPEADPTGNAAPNTIGWGRKTSVQYLVVFNTTAGNIYSARKNGVIASSGTYALRFNEMNFGTIPNQLKMFEMYANGVRYSNDDSNSSAGTSGFGEKSFVKIYGNIGGRTIDYIMVKRYMANQPNITLGTVQDVNTYNSSFEDMIGTYVLGVLPSASIYTDQQIYARYLNGTQMLGTFDVIAAYGSQRWAFNYILTGDNYTNLFNMTPSLYVWEHGGLSMAELQEQVEALITSTKA